MSLKDSLSKVLVFAILEIGALCGIPMTPKQIEELLHTLDRSHHEHVVKRENDTGPE